MTHPLSALFDPASIAVVGASANPVKWGYHMARHTLLGAEQRRCYLVNPSGGEILGQPTYPSLDALPETPEFVVLAVPATACEAVIEQALAMGSRGFLIAAGGFGETDAAGAELESRILSRIHDAGARLFGPNCIGLHDAASAFHAGRILYPCGPIGVVSQSGVVVHDLSRYCAADDTGFSRVINLGNQGDVNLCESVASFAGHAETKALIVYCEDLLDGREFMRSAAAVIDSGIPLILLTVGASEVAAASARSHTGALVSDMAVVDAACAMVGAQRVTTIQQAYHLAYAHATCARKPRGARIGLLSDGGGLATVSAEILSLQGLDLPRLSDPLRERLRAVSGARTITGNPVDLAGEADQDVSIYASTAHEILHSGEVDALFFSSCLGFYTYNADGMADSERETAHRLVKSVETSGIPAFMHTLYPASDTGDILRRGGLPVYRDMAAAAESLAGLVQFGQRPQSSLPDTLPAPAATLLPETYWPLRETLADQGIPFTPGRRVEQAQSLEAAADDLGFPLVLKAVHLLHKSDAGGVVTGIGDLGALRETWKRMQQAFGAHNLCLEQEAPVADGVELLVGVRIDPRFGPVVSVGMGGIYTELFRQVAVGLAPMDPDRAVALIDSLPGAGLLRGARGRPPLDVDAAARVVARLGDIACAHRDQIDALEINPLLVLADGVVALDARVTGVEERRVGGPERRAHEIRRGGGLSHFVLLWRSGKHPGCPEGESGGTSEEVRGAGACEDLVSLVGGSDVPDGDDRGRPVDYPQGRGVRGVDRDVAGRGQLLIARRDYRELDVVERVPEVAERG